MPVQNISHSVFLFKLLDCIFAGNEAAVLTPDDYRFKHGWLQVADRRHVVFRVLACNNSHIALAQFEDTESKTYEVVIGGWKNTQSAIRTERLGALKATVRFCIPFLRVHVYDHRIMPFIKRKSKLEIKSYLVITLTVKYILLHLIDADDIVYKRVTSS